MVIKGKAQDYLLRTWPALVVGISSDGTRHLLGQEQANLLAQQVIDDCNRLGRLPQAQETRGYSDSQCVFLTLLHMS